MNKDAIKENLTFLRLVFTSTVAFLAGSMAYLVSNLDNIGFLVYLDAVFILLLIALLVSIVAEIKFYIRKLED